MPIDDFDAWRSELLATGNIVQDADDSVPQPEAERRFHRYRELADLVDGTEGPKAVAALVSSMQARHDYGAYQATHSALARFPLAELARGMILAAPALVAMSRDRAGEVLLPVALAETAIVEDFTHAAADLDQQMRDELAAVIASQEEEGGWFDRPRARGRLRVGPFEATLADELR
ncbi:hypothetical protein [Kitasatospora mediocidica]|uniref:hypothetical protein n=1 Tax=Kitasatospora mediocidica TaxID=58352 RepID=UPI000567A0DB|nr:hypothetical protein [Kitasatospora mediocidica]